MSGHTKEPWKMRQALHPVDGGYDYAIGAEVDEDGPERCIAEAFARLAEDVYAPAEANARRICLCVNSLAGIPDEALEADAIGKARDALHIIWRSSFADRMSADEMRVAMGGVNEQARAALALLNKDPQP